MDVKKQLDAAFALFDKGAHAEAEALYLSCLHSTTDRTGADYKSALHGLGYVKSAQGEFKLAKTYYTELLGISEGAYERASAYHQLGMVERMAGDYGNAKVYFSKELEIWEEQDPRFDLGFAANFYEQGYLALKQKMYSAAAELFARSLEHAEKSKDPIAIACAQRGLGELAEALMQFGRAKKHFNLSLQFFQIADEKIAAGEVQEMIVRLS